jgi:hypothetical protein
VRDLANVKECVVNFKLNEGGFGIIDSNTELDCFGITVNLAVLDVFRYVHTRRELEASNVDGLDHGTGSLVHLDESRWYSCLVVNIEHHVVDKILHHSVCSGTVKLQKQSFSLPRPNDNH